MDERSGPAKQGAAAVSGGRRWRLWLSGALILGGLIVLVVHRGEIGQVLSISPNTVANHVRSILEKTYTANRTEAAAFANREGLVEP